MRQVEGGGGEVPNRQAGSSQGNRPGSPTLMGSFSDMEIRYQKGRTSPIEKVEKRLRRDLRCAGEKLQNGDTRRGRVKNALAF